MICQRNPPAAARDVQLAIVRAAFTLMEMLIVVAIIAALAGLGGFYMLNQYKESQKKTARVKIAELSQAVTTFQLNNPFPPQNLQQLMAQDGVGGPYIKSSDALYDPWGQLFQYNPNGMNPETGLSEPEISTVAPDGTRISNLGPQRSR